MMDEEKDAFLAFCQIEKGLSSHTTEAYARDLQHLFDFFQEISITSLQQIQHFHLASWIKWLYDKKFNESTVVRHRVAMRQFFKYLYMEGILAENPSQHLSGPKTKMPLPKVITEAQVEKILEQPKMESILGLRDAAMLELMYGTGLRVTELVNLRREHWHKGWIEVIGKRGKQRIIPYGDKAGELVAQYWQQILPIQSEYVFLSSHRKPMTRQNFWERVKKYVKSAGVTVNVSPHTLRHAFATHMLNHGADLRALQQMLGHADISTTEIYTRVSELRLRKSHSKFHPRG